MQGNFVSSISGNRIRFVFNIMLPSIVLGIAESGLLIRKGNEIWLTKGIDTFEKASKVGIIQDKKIPRAEVKCMAILCNDDDMKTDATLTDSWTIGSDFYPFRLPKRQAKKRTVIDISTVTHPADQFNGVYGRTQAFILLLEHMVQNRLITSEDAHRFFDEAPFRKSNEAYRALYRRDNPKLVKPVKVKTPYVRETAGV